MSGRRPQRYPGSTWLGAGVLIGNTGVLVMQFIAWRDWPYPQRHSVDNLVLVSMLAGGGCYLQSFRVKARSRRTRAADPSGLNQES